MNLPILASMRDALLAVVDAFGRGAAPIWMGNTAWAPADWMEETISFPLDDGHPPANNQYHPHPDEAPDHRL